jgi:2-amino-4-hydroxy-6-hydroxymethyldihydropteridine diphosphokinase
MARVVLGLGSNRQRQQHINAGLAALHQQFASAQHPLACSRVFESAAVGFAGHDFYNCVVELISTQSLLDISNFCKATERQFGHRSDAPKFSPRTLDMDILLYDDWVCQQPLVLPRDEILTNAFVLWPLAELLPHTLHPVTGTSYAALWASYQLQQRIQPLDFEFVSLPHLRIVCP